jgi:hypothetical protein
VSFGCELPELIPTLHRCQADFDEHSMHRQRTWFLSSFCCDSRHLGSKTSRRVMPSAQAKNCCR